MKRILTMVAVVISLLGVSAMAKEGLQFQIKDIPPRYVLLLKGKSSLQNIGQDMGSLYGKVYAYMTTKKIDPIGPPIALYYSEPGPEWRIGAAVPVPDGTMGQGAIESTTLPGGKMASTIHMGPYDKLGESWSALSDWIQKSQYKPGGHGREVFLVGPAQESDPAKFRTELLWPVN